MTSTTEIKNLAVSHLGIATDLGSATNDKSAEAISAELFFPFALDDIRRRHQWSFTTIYASLQLVTENPNDEWAYAYAYPSDCLYFRKILSGVRNETNKTRVSFEPAIIKDSDDNNTHVILTDKSEAVGKYTLEIDKVSIYPSDFSLALSYRLAYMMASRVTGGDPFKLQERMLANFNFELNNAIKNDNNERQRDPMPKSKYEAARRGNTGVSQEDSEQIYGNNSVIS